MACKNFPRSLALVLAQEGGFVDHPADSGGPTRFGITQATLARARRSEASAEDVRALTEAEAGAIYEELFWNVIRGDDLPAGLDLAMFDLAVNAGPGRAARLLQAILSVPSDGIIGPVTLAAARDVERAWAIRTLTERRLRFLSGLAGWPIFGRGWRRRAFAIERAALRLAGEDPSLPHPQPRTEIPMIDTKPLLASRTLWANAVGLAAVALGLFGFDTSQLDVAGFSEAAVQLIAAASFVLSTVFRIAATKQLAR
jgi:lysozyme family protein